MEADRTYEIQRLASVMSGYRGSQRKGRPHKELSKNSSGVSDPGGPPTNSNDKNKIRKKLVEGMEQMNMKPNKHFLEILEGEPRV